MKTHDPNNETTATYEPTVYLTNYKHQDVSHAKMFGRIKVITTAPVIETFKLDLLSRQVTDALAESRPEDWLICTGHMVLGIITAVEFLRKHHRLNLLLWHSKEKKYIPRVLHMRQGPAPDADVIEPILSEILYSEMPVELA